jgi:hypothetical protein
MLISWAIGQFFDWAIKNKWEIWQQQIALTVAFVPAVALALGLAARKRK